MSADSRSTAATGFWSTTRAHLVDGALLLRRAGWRLWGVLALVQLVIMLASIPLIQWLFRSALRSAGMTGLDLGQLEMTGGLPITLGLIVAIAIVALWLVSLQFAVLVIMLRRARDTATPSLHGLSGELRRVVAKLARPSSFPLVTYLFIVLPLAGFGFISTLTHGISLPLFITGELRKTTGGSLFLGALFAVIGLANVRLSLTLPAFTTTKATGGQAMRASWRITRGRTGFMIVLGVLAITVTAAAAGLLVIACALLPTLVSDQLAPGAAPAVAAMSLGLAQVLGATLTAITTAWISGFLLTVFESRKPADAVPVSAAPIASGVADRRWKAAVLAAGISVTVVLGVSNLTPMSRIAAQPETLVLAHRGYTAEGVENTIGSLEAAATLGVDLVEMDVMQTRDGGFIAMHDAALGRLAGVDAQVKDLTTAELTALSVSDLLGHEQRIPSFTEYVTRATELDMPLLIEIKLSGAETDDHVDLLVAELEALGVLEEHLYHSLDAASVARLKQLRPDLTVGYTMAFAAQEAPDTPADFIVVEQWTATEEVRRSAVEAGLGFWVWTVNDDPSIRAYIRAEVDGIITDRPDAVMATRSAVSDETGLAGRLLDALSRWVTVF